MPKNHFTAKIHIKDILSYIPRGRFRLLIGAELLFLLLLTVNSLVSAPNSLTITPSEFDLKDLPDVFLYNDQLLISDGGESKDSITLKTGSYEIGSGCYEVTVRYASSVNGEQKVSNAAGSLALTSSHGIEVSSLIFDDAHSTIKGRLWVPIASKTDDLAAELTFNGTGSLELYSIELQEAGIYRLMRWIGFLFLFALIDIFIYLFLAASPFKKNRTVSVTLVGLTAVSSIILFSNLMIAGHDLDFHIMRIAGIAEALEGGQFPVRMETELCNGYSYPLSIYYCDIFLYLSAILYSCMVPIHICYKIYVVCVNAATAWISYYSFKRITGDQNLGLLGSAIYTLSIYRVMDTYLRASVGEYTAMTFFPLIILGMYLIYTEENPGWRQWLPLTAGMSGVIMSHVLSTEMVAFLLILACLLNFKKTLRPARLLAFMKAAAVCVLLCAWFLVPMLEYLLTQETSISGDVTQIQPTGLYPFQIAALFFNGTGWSINNSVQNEMPLTLGPSLTVGTICILYCFWKRHEWNSSRTVQMRICKELFILSLMSIVFTLWCFPWTRIQLISESIAHIVGILRIVWRFLALTTALLVPAILLSLAEIKSHNRKIYLLSVFSICAAMVIGFGFFCYQYTSNNALTEKYVVTNQELTKVIGGEYFLNGSNNNTFETSALNVVSGDIVCHYEKASGIAYVHVENTASDGATIEVPIFAYSHYQATGIETGQDFSIDYGSGNRIFLRIPGDYQGTIEVRFVPPVYWRISELISVAALAVLLVYIHRQSKMERKGRAAANPAPAA